MALATHKEAADTKDSDDVGVDYDVRARHSAVVAKFRSYFQVTLQETGASSVAEAEKLRTWIGSQRATSEGVRNLEEAWSGWYLDAMISAKSLHKKFMNTIAEAESKNLISGSSKAKWIQRFKNPNLNYKAKEYWVEHQLPHYIQAWEGVMKERNAVVSDPRFKNINASLLNVSKLLDPKAFLELHYNDRKGMLSKAKAAMEAKEKGQGDLYSQAKSMLYKAVSKKVMAGHKVGGWLERIFKSGASRAKIESFLAMDGSNSLPVLIGKWERVKQRFDRVSEKVKQRGKSNVRGWHDLTENQFLDMHYNQRLQYVTEAEHRLTGANDISKELPIFVQIRHALDIKDWDDASGLIAKAKTMELSPDNRGRLSSMSSYLKQFRPPKSKDKKGGGPNVEEARKKIDHLMTQVKPELQDVVRRGLRSSDPNRYIHQMRWMIYNHDWCTRMGYLTPKRQREGANKSNEERTHTAGRKGGDTGRHDVLNTKNSGKQFIRKEEFSRNKATYRHVDVKSKDAMDTVGEWLEKEQHPKTMYWTTMCFNDGGDPLSEGWHRDMVMILGGLRSATRTLKAAGVRYEPSHSVAA
jgi:hypothetical protein